MQRVTNKSKNAEAKPANKKPRSYSTIDSVAKKNSLSSQVEDNDMCTEYRSAATKANVKFHIITSYKPESRMTAIEKMELAVEGISKKRLEIFKKEVEFDYDQLSHVFSVARTTLINKKGNSKFNTDISEKIVAVSDIFSYGFEVFEDKEKFKKWIQRDNIALGGKAPYELLSSEFGREEVKNLIGRIDHGVYS